MRNDSCCDNNVCCIVCILRVIFSCISRRTRAVALVREERDDDWEGLVRRD